MTTLGEDEEVKDFSRWEIKRSTLMKCAPTTISFYSHRNDEVDHFSTLSRHSSSSSKADRRGGRGHQRKGGRNSSSSATAAAAAAAARASTYCPVTACASEASTARVSAFSASASAANEEGAKRVDPTALETNRGQEWAEIQRLASINGRSELPPLRTQHHAR